MRKGKTYEEVARGVLHSLHGYPPDSLDARPDAVALADMLEVRDCTIRESLIRLLNETGQIAAARQVQEWFETRFWL